MNKFENYIIFSAPNGLYDHDGQLLFLYQQESYCMTNQNYKIIQIFNNVSLYEFKLGGWLQIY
jgi:hypothetical protein